MGKKIAMSALGYAIVLVIILGVVMIISAPMMADKFKNKEHNNQQDSISDDTRSSSERDEYYDSSSSRPVKDDRGGSDYLFNEVRNIERRMNDRIDNLELRQREMQNNQTNSASVSNKYVCTIEGSLDANNNVVPLDAQNSADIKSQKFVFVCEYRE